MTIHPDLHRAIVTKALEDAIRETWMASIPPAFRKAGINTGLPREKADLIDPRDFRAMAKRGGAIKAKMAAEARSSLRDKVAALLDQGASINEIACELGTTHCRVKQIIKEHGLTANPTVRSKVEAVWPTVTAMRTAGASWTDIAAAVEMHRGTLRNHAIKLEARQAIQNNTSRESH